MTDFAASTKRIELTGRALILGSLLGIVFTAANVYLGLKVGLTFASAIPAAVISMALLRAFKTSTIWENMTVQTVASVGGACPRSSSSCLRSSWSAGGRNFPSGSPS